MLFYFVGFLNDFLYIARIGEIVDYKTEFALEVFDFVVVIDYSLYQP